MAPPIYFFPKTTLGQIAPEGRILRSALRERGLERSLADVEEIQRDASCFGLTGAGPGGFSGVLLSAIPPGVDPPRIHFKPEFQEWAEVIPEKLWIGTDTEHPIEPADLARKRQHAGYQIELAGQTWTVPVIRNPEGGTGLPQDWNAGGNGDVTETIQAQYQRAWDEFASVVDVFFSEDDSAPAGVFQMDRGEAMNRCLDVLLINYRFDRREQNLLHLIGSETWQTILSAAVDLFTFWDMFQATQASKKKRDLALLAALQATSPGPEENSPDTDPVAASSSCSPVESE